MIGELLKLQAATMAARQRTGDKTIGTRVEAGRVQVIRVTYDASGKSTVEPLAAPMPAADAIAHLQAML